MAVNTLLEGSELEDFVKGELARFLYCAFDGNGHGAVWNSGRFWRIGLIGAEFVEIVVSG